MPASPAGIWFVGLHSQNASCEASKGNQRGRRNTIETRGSTRMFRNLLAEYWSTLTGWSGVVIAAAAPMVQTMSEWGSAIAVVLGAVMAAIGIAYKLWSWVQEWRALQRRVARLEALERFATQCPATCPVGPTLKADLRDSD